ncbi:cyclin-d5-3 [Phtheirospermum japonicum]|uniref:Cyclin-d5-3 n=1 Tax=Phtheirospermum japonicum TaxID=374723 RepID=A0A830CNN7_9LAMI|nr:cyclin-d5-3 [Phtheirospermum japonicum]
MENSQSMCSPTSLLLCKENVAFLEDRKKELEEFDWVLDDDCDNEYLKTLLEKEIACGVLQFQDSWIARARLDAIQYIIKTSVLLGFRLQTAYVSVTYLDRFLSRRSIDGDNNSWAMRLLSMACLSLAAKMDEVSVPPLPHFCVDDYNFESQVIQRMELLVLNELGWTMGSITPFSFVDFFAKKFSVNTEARNGVSRIEEVILGAMGDVKIMCHKPSVIAAAATLFVLDRGFPRDALQFKIGPVASSHSFDIENIVSCYYLVQEMEFERSNVSKGIESPYLSPIQLQKVEPCASSSITSSVKRKRLVFNQSDEFEDVHDKKGKS